MLKRLYTCFIVIACIGVAGWFLFSHPPLLENLNEVFLLDKRSGKVLFYYDEDESEFIFTPVSDIWRVRSIVEFLDNETVMYSEISKTESDNDESFIYTLSLEDGAESPNKIIQGKQPVLSPNRKTFLFKRWEESDDGNGYNIWLYDFELSVERELCRDIDNNKAPIWIDDNTFCYFAEYDMDDLAKQYPQEFLYKVQIEPFKIERWPLENYRPSEVSSDGKFQILLKRESWSISLNSLDLITGEIEELKNQPMIDKGWDVVWNSNSDGFLFSQEIYDRGIFGAASDLYYYDLSAKKSFLISKDFYIVSRGVSIPTEYAEIFLNNQ